MSLSSTTEALRRRQSLLVNHNVPGQHETNGNLGVPLAKTVFRTLSPVAKELMGIENPLSKPPKIMWINPTDILSGKPVTITQPPPQIAKIKAFTHDTLMGLGVAIETKFQYKVAGRIEKAIADNEQFERFECKNRIQFAVEQKEAAEKLIQKLNEERLPQMFEEERQQMLNDHEEKLRVMTEEMEAKYSIIAEEAIAEAAAEFERASLELEIRWRIEEATYKACMEEMERNAKLEIELVTRNSNAIFQFLYNLYVRIETQKLDTFN